MLTFSQAADQGKVKLLITDASGIYCPQEFAQSFVVMESILDGAMEICASGPDEEYYWDAWTEILDGGTIQGKDHKWTVMQDGDVWAIRSDVEIDWEEI